MLKIKRQHRHKNLLARSMKNYTARCEEPCLFAPQKGKKVC